MPQGLGLYLDMTVAENVSFNAAAFGISTDQIVLNKPLREMSDRPVGSIGLGRQRQLAYTCALGHLPELVVLDEPTSGVDPLARAHLWDTIRSEAQRGAGMLVTTHYMDEAQQCDRLVLMAAGHVAAEGTLADIIAGRTVVQVTAATWSEAFAALCDAGHDVTLAGRRIRVGGADVSQVSQTLRAAGIDASWACIPQRSTRRWSPSAPADERQAPRSPPWKRLEPERHRGSGTPRVRRPRVRAGHDPFDRGERQGRPHDDLPLLRRQERPHPPRHWSSR